MVSPDARLVPMAEDRPSCPPEGEHASRNFDPLVLVSWGSHRAESRNQGHINALLTRSLYARPRESDDAMDRTRFTYGDRGTNGAGLWRLAWQASQRPAPTGSSRPRQRIRDRAKKREAHLINAPLALVMAPFFEMHQCHWRPAGR